MANLLHGDMTVKRAGVAKNVSQERGGVIVEFLITLPLLIVFLVGILSSGRLLSALATTGQAAFLGGVMVSQVNNLSELDLVPERVHKILCLQNRRLKNLNCGGVTLPGGLVTKTTDTGNRTISIKVDGEFDFMLKHIDLDVKVTAPMLLLDQLPLTELANPKNTVEYKCEVIDGSNSKCDCCSGASAKGDYCKPGVCTP
ncbi:MAG: pilus assembly protein [Deltaproteobacteria bacterium]|nr:pilus assembly protein [Deltaproteobacteria bacterium]